MSEQYSTFVAVFAPKRTDDLRYGSERWIGRMHEWRRLWIIEDGPYAGQWACEAADRSLLTPFAWVPECDLTPCVTADNSSVSAAGEPPPAT